MITLLRKEPVGDVQRDRFARAAELFRFFYEFSCLRAHLSERTLKRRERGGHVAAIWKMQNTRHLATRFAIGAGKRHGQRAVDRERRDAEVFATCRELSVKIDSEFVRRFCGQVKTRRALRHRNE